MAYAADEGCCGDEEAEGAIERISQAARYLVQVGGWVGGLSVLA